MRQERRIFLEAVVVSVLGHAIFFSVFTVKESEAFKTTPTPPTSITIAQFKGVDLLGTRATTNPAATDPDLLAHVELERRTAAPRLELDRTTLVWEDEPELAAPPPPQVGPATWGFAKEPARLPDEFPTDYDAGPSLAMAREALAAGTGGGLQPRIPFAVALERTPGDQAPLLSAGHGAAEEARPFRGELRLDLARGRLDCVVRPSGDPQIDAAIMNRGHRWELTIEHTPNGYRLCARPAVPVSMRAGGAARRPLSADELLGEKPAEESP